MTQAFSDPGGAELARIAAVVTSIPLAVDLGAFDLAEAAFAPLVTIDYTSLWGGEAQTMTSAALIKAWRALIPGFDATRHALQDVTAIVAGDRATAGALVDARHWLDDNMWGLTGRYEWALERRHGRWLVTAMTLIMAQEIGDRGLVALATERARRG